MTPLSFIYLFSCKKKGEKERKRRYWFYKSLLVLHKAYLHFYHRIPCWFIHKFTHFLWSPPISPKNYLVSLPSDKTIKGWVAFLLLIKKDICLTAIEHSEQKYFIKVLATAVNILLRIQNNDRFTENDR
jgi:hypothetical protein